MYELSEYDEENLLEQYYVSENVLIKFATFFGNLNFVKTYNEFLLLCETACSRYQSDKVYNDYLLSQDKHGYKINICDVIYDALKEVYEEPEDMNYVDMKELESCKRRLLHPKKRHI